MAYNVRTLLKDIGMPDDDQSSVLALLDKHPDAIRKIESKLNEFSSTVESERNELASKRSALEAEWDTLRAYRGNDAKVVAEVEDRAERLASQVAIAEQRVRRACADAGLDPAPYLKDLTPPDPVVKKETPVSSSMDSTAIIQQAGALAWNGTMMSAHLQDLAEEHRSLFGKPFTDATGLLARLSEEARRTGNTKLTPRDIWLREQKVDEFKQTKLEADIKSREEAAYQRGVQKATDDAALRVSATPPVDPSRPRSPIFDAIPSAVVVTPEGGDAVSAAILDFRKRRAALNAA